MFLSICSAAPRLIFASTLLAVTGCELFSAPEEGEGRGLQLKTLWYQPHAGYARPMPAALGDLVYTATGAGQVIARDIRTGSARWSVTVGGASLQSANLVARSGVVVAPVVYHTVALDAATGRELWRYLAPIDSVGGGPPNPGTVAKVRVEADDEAAYISAWGASVAAVELRTGRVRWQWTPDPGTPFRFGAEGVALDRGEVFLVASHALDVRGTRCEMWVVALDARTGSQLWIAKVPARGSISCTAGRPGVTADRVVAMLITGEVFGLDRKTGAVVWSVPRDTASYLSVLSSPAVRDGTVYTGTGDDHLRALRASDGQPLWRTPVRAQFVDDLLVTEKRIIGVDGPYLFVFDRPTGKLLARAEQPHPPKLGGVFPATPASIDGRIIAPVNGGVWAFQEP